MAEARRGRDLLLLIGYFLLTTNQSPLHEGEIINSRSKIANNKQSPKTTFLSVPSKDKIDNALKRSWLRVASKTVHDERIVIVESHKQRIPNLWFLGFAHVSYLDVERFHLIDGLQSIGRLAQESHFSIS
jgi:hypothetical protein